MSQASTVIDANQDGTGFAAALNAALAALLTAFSGPSAPSSPSAYQLWADTTANVLKLRNGANTAWITLGALAGWSGSAAAQNLAITHAAGGNTVTTFTVSADLLSVQGTVLAAVSDTISTAAGNGPGKLDTGSWATATWYALHEICNEDGSLHAAMASLSATNPSFTNATGYTRFRRVGWLRTDGTTATNLRALTQIGDHAVWDDDDPATHPLNGGSATSFTAVSLASYVPPGTTLALVTVFLDEQAASGFVSMYLRATGSTVTTGRQVAQTGGNSGGGGGTNTACANQRWATCDVNRSVDYRLSSGSALAFLNVDGWLDPLMM